MQRSGCREEASSLYQSAAELNRDGAENGNAACQDRLGFAYESGLGVDEDFAEAVKWYRMAANSGDAFSQTSLGRMYEHGKGVVQNIVEAIKWYRKAADQGHADAQDHLGQIYATGQGVLQDETEAAKWFGRASEQYLNASGEGELFQLNGFAWRLATGANLKFRDPQKAVLLCKRPWNLRRAMANFGIR